MRLRFITISAALALLAGAVWASVQFTSTAAAQKSKVIYPVKIEATELDALILMQKLNEKGGSDNISFVRVESDFTYLIKFETFQGNSSVLFSGSGGSFNTSSAGAKVFDPKGVDLFEFIRANRGTDKGATNAAAEEIIKRIKEYRKLAAKEK